MALQSLRSAVLVAMLSVGVGTAAAAKAPLSFEQRVSCREKVEDVYWARRLWPRENKTPKPQREAVVPRSAVARRVEESLRYEAALAALWGQPLTQEAVQAEIDREARSTRDPAMLRALWAALGNDPNLVAECLVKPELAERRIQELYAGDHALHAAARRRAESELAAARAGGGLKALRTGTGQVTATVWIEKGRAAERQLAPGMVALGSDGWAHLEEALVEAFPAIPAEGPLGAPGRLGPAWLARHSLPGPRWQERRTIAGLPLGALSPLREGADGFRVVQLQERSEGRVQVVTVSWPKEGFAEWWKDVRESFAPRVPDASVYRLAALAGRACSSDTWSITPNLAMPSERSAQSVVWTGSEMIVWGGVGLGDLGSGGRYVPGTDSWAAMTTAGAPTPRDSHTAVWTGSEMIVWGGRGLRGAPLNSGGRYQPMTDSWAPTNTTGAPDARADHTAVWTGTEMIVWGGAATNSGGRYQPSTDSWVATSTTGAPAARGLHTAVWTGSVMIVWGGLDFTQDPLNGGGVYTPSTDSWTATDLTGAPEARYYHTAVWTGTAMIVWGGFDGLSPGSLLNDGGVYTPGTDSWAATSLTGAPTGRQLHTAVWTGSEMIVWGGFDLQGTNIFNDGGRYTPETDRWVSTSTTGAPAPRANHTAIWTGSEMIVWGGFGGLDDLGFGEEEPIYFNSGGRYAPQTDSWVATNTTGAATQRFAQTALWTGTEMIVWGGSLDGPPLNTGARYLPATDSWMATNTTGSPVLGNNTAVWTGIEMIVWGLGGARYSPGTDEWAPTSTVGAPESRTLHTAVWTGSEMIIWGGYGSTLLNSGGRYNPMTDSWVATSTTGAPDARDGATAVWTGSQMIVWGGYDFNTGGRYTPSTDSWLPTSSASAPGGRYYHTAVWTGSQMIVWGGFNDENGPAGIALDDGALYTPRTDIWAPTSATDAPTPRYSHTAVWTGTEMIVWGGTGTDASAGDGGRYTPGTDSWAATNAAGAPQARTQHTAVWTGRQMIIWGGDSFLENTWAEVLGNGGLYCAVADSPPVAYAQSLVVAENASLAITLTATDPDGDALTYAIVGNPAHGTLSGTPPAVTYRPAIGYYGLDSFTFKANDGALDSNVATISLRVDGVPVASAQSLVVAENGSLPITLTATDPDGDALTYTTLGNPAHGALNGTPPAVTYRPATGYFGPDGFTFKANDGLSDSNVATVAIVVVKPAGGRFYTVAPCRLFDSRLSTGPLLTGVEEVIQAAGHCGVPATARAVAVNVTVVLPTTSGYLNLYAAPGIPHPTSVENFAAGQVRANNAVVQVSESGSLVALLSMGSGGNADLIVDTSGYFK